MLKNFRTVDITHKPKRYQSKVEEEMLAEQGIDIKTSKIEEVPSGFITIERAIHHYESGAKGNPLYERTAEWLHELLDLRNNKYKPSEEGGDNSV